MDEHMISNIARSMREFQKTNRITKQCLTNTQYLYSCIKSNTSCKVKVKAVLVVSNKTNTTKIIVHLVVQLENKNVEGEAMMLEPSYDVFSLKDKSYFDNIKDFMDTYSHKFNDVFKDTFKKTISEFINFTKLAERINNGELLICDKKFYDDQADYIESIIKKTKN